MDRGVGPGAGGEVADHKVVDAHGEGDEGPVEHTGQDLGQDHLAEGVPPVAPRSWAGLKDVGIQLAAAWA